MEMDSRQQPTIVFAIDGAIRPEEVTEVCNAIGAMLRRSGAGSAIVDVESLRPDASAVDALARLALTARRLGMSLVLRNATAELAALLCFVGVAEVLGVEPVREPEQEEQPVGVEEERDLDDLAG